MLSWRRITAAGARGVTTWVVGGLTCQGKACSAASRHGVAERGVWYGVVVLLNGRAGGWGRLGQGAGLALWLLLLLRTLRAA